MPTCLASISPTKLRHGDEFLENTICMIPGMMQTKQKVISATFNFIHNGYFLFWPNFEIEESRLYTKLQKNAVIFPTKLQKMQLSSLHSKTIFHNYNGFFDSFLYEQRFSHRLFYIKSLQYCV